MASVETESTVQTYQRALNNEERRLVVVSNAEPYAHYRDEAGRIKQEKLAGGLTSAIDPLMQETGGIWIAWGREEADFDVLDGEGKLKVPNEDGYKLKRLKLSDEEVEGFYRGFSNEVLWPLCHSFLDKTKLNDFQYCKEKWSLYKRVNEKYAEAVLEEFNGDDLIWIHDYHLTLVPKMLRMKKPYADISFFWHIPWPSWGIFRNLPWKGEILESMSASNFIGFHTSTSKSNFTSCVRKMSQNNREDKGIFNAGEIGEKVDSLPLGIDYKRFSKLSQEEGFNREAQELEEKIPTEYILLGIDRLDYTKGIPQRLKAFDLLLERNPELRENVTLIQRIPPSREKIDEYQRTLKKIQGLIGEINGRFGTAEWSPIKSFHSFLPEQEQIIPYYMSADVALVTSLIDGMNLVSKEFIASTDEGVLVLSEFAGAAEELEEAIQVNPYDPEETAAAIRTALSMPRKEKMERLNRLKERVRENDLSNWRRKFMKDWKDSEGGKN